jgi:uncharacterized protein YukE
MRPSEPASTQDLSSLLPHRPQGDCLAMQGLAKALRQRAQHLLRAGQTIAKATPKKMWEGPQAEAFYRRMDDLQHLAHQSLPHQLSALADELDRECASVAEAQESWDRGFRQIDALAQDAVRRGEDVAATVGHHLARLFG